MFELPQIVLIVAGAATHWFYFKQDERHLYPLRYVGALILGCAVSAALLSHYAKISKYEASLVSMRSACVYLSGIFASTLLYRLLANPLNDIPGPFTARLTKLDHVFRNLDLLGHQSLQRMHKKYGKIVRIGPNDVSIIDPECVQIISSPQSRCTKAQWYSNDTPLISMHTTRGRALHDKRRRVWAPAFSDKALRGYEARIEQYNKLLLDVVDKNEGKPLNVTKWFNALTFDVMGDLGFGQSFDMLESGKEHWAIKLLSGGMDPLGWSLPPWLFRTLIAIPGASGEYHSFINFCNKRLDDRIKVQGKDKNPDISHVLIEHYNGVDQEAKQQALHMLQGDARLIIVAGSDTTAATLTHLFYHLANEKALVEKLRNELRPLIGADGKIENVKIQDANLLNGCINEALRLNPPVPSGVFRKTPKEGVHVGKTFIPGDTVIQMPTYVMGHDEDCYVDCEAFVPERWYSKPEMIKHKDAFGTFSAGPFGCIGKNLAYMEVRLLTAHLVMKYDVAFAPGEDGMELLMKSTDHFTMGLKDLNLVFTKKN